MQQRKRKSYVYVDKRSVRSTKGWLQLHSPLVLPRGLAAPAFQGLRTTHVLSHHDISLVFAGSERDTRLRSEAIERGQLLALLDTSRVTCQLS